MACANPNRHARAFLLMAITDPLGPSEVGVAANSSAEKLLDSIAAGACQHERLGVPRSVMDQLAAIGWLGIASSGSLQRERAERLAMADAAVWFCWAQHQSPLRLLQISSNTALKDRWLDLLGCGRAVGATAFAHLRRPGQANPVAHSTAYGWELNGQLDWITGWDLADVVALQLRAGPESDAPVLAFLLSKSVRSTLPQGVYPQLPLELMAMSGTWSRPVKLNNCCISEAELLSTTPIEEWHQSDQTRTRFANPAAFGLIRAALGDLNQQAERRSNGSWLNIGRQLLEEARDLRANCYAAIDHPDVLSDARHHDLRAAALLLAQRCCQAALISHSGEALHSGHPTGRRLREAVFLHVQALIPPVQNRLISGSISRPVGDPWLNHDQSLGLASQSKL